MKAEDIQNEDSDDAWADRNAAGLRARPVTPTVTSRLWLAFRRVLHAFMVRSWILS